MEGIERALGGAFDTIHAVIGDFMESREEFVECCYEKYERIPSIEIRIVFTFKI